MLTCKNCAAPFEGKFCPQCGQKAKVKRITTKSVLTDVRQSLIHYDQGFLHTILALLRRPGHLVREYLEGKRVSVTKPVKFILWATALNFLVFHLVGLDQDMVHALSGQQGQTAATMKLTRYIFDHPAIVIFLMIPCISCCSWLFFRRQGYNYAEHVVLNAYLMGEVSLFGVVLNPLLKAAAPGNTLFLLKIILQVGCWLGYMGWGYAQFFQSRRRLLTWLKTALSVLCGYFLLLIIISILVMVVVMLFGAGLKSWLTGGG